MQQLFLKVFPFLFTLLWLVTTHYQASHHLRLLSAAHRTCHVTSPGGNTQQWLFLVLVCFNRKHSSETLTRGVRVRTCTGMTFKWFGDLICDLRVFPYFVSVIQGSGAVVPGLSCGTFHLLLLMLFVQRLKDKVFLYHSLTWWWRINRIHSNSF